MIEGLAHQQYSITTAWPSFRKLFPLYVMGAEARGQTRVFGCFSNFGTIALL